MSQTPPEQNKAPLSQQELDAELLKRAASNCDAPLLKMLIKAGANPLATTGPRGMPALMLAVQQGSFPAARCLLTVTPPDIRNALGETSMMLAAKNMRRGPPNVGLAKECELAPGIPWERRLAMEMLGEVCDMSLKDHKGQTAEGFADMSGRAERQRRLNASAAAAGAPILEKLSQRREAGGGEAPGAAQNAKPAAR